MATCTPIYGLPYITGSDRPCDQAATWCDFALAVETEFDGLDAIVDRAVDTTPFAWVRSTVPQTVLAAGTDTISYDSVLFDTDNMVSLTADSTLVTINRTGLWDVTFSATVATSGVANNVGGAQFSATTSSDGWVDNGVTTPYYPSFSALLRVDSVAGISGDLVVPASIRITITLNNGANVNVTTADLTVAWRADL